MSENTNNKKIEKINKLIQKNKRFKSNPNYFQRNSSAITAFATIALCLVTAIYVVATYNMSKTAKKSLTTANKMTKIAEKNLNIANRMTKIATDNLGAYNEMLKTSKGMLKSAETTIIKMEKIHQEEMRPYLVYQLHTFHREGRGRFYSVWILNKGRTPARDVLISVNPSKIKINKTIRFLGPEQGSLIFLMNNFQMKEEKVSFPFKLSLGYSNSEGQLYQQKITVQMENENPNTLASIREQLFNLNSSIDEIRRIYKYGK